MANPLIFLSDKPCSLIHHWTAESCGSATKIFDKVWHNVLLSKPKASATSDDFPPFISSFFTFVVLVVVDVVSVDEFKISSRVSQCSVLLRTIFLSLFCG